jgi:hypothetical protein
LTLRGNNSQAIGSGSATGETSDPDRPPSPWTSPEPRTPEFYPFGNDGTSEVPYKLRKECPDCCFRDLAHECWEATNYEPSRPCWFSMCCCARADTVNVFGGSIVCPEYMPPGVPCIAECCKSSVFEDLPKKAYRPRSGSLGIGCGGATKGMCWANNSVRFNRHVHGAFSDYAVKSSINRMCSVINDIGCLEWCADQVLLCECLKDFCDCKFYPDLNYNSGSRSFSAGDPFNLYVDSEADWTDLFHELIHFCLWRYNQYNFEATAHACERICEPLNDWGIADYEKFQWEREESFKNVSPCCCSINPPPECAKLGETLLHGLIQIISLGKYVY